MNKSIAFTAIVLLTIGVNAAQAGTAGSSTTSSSGFKSEGRTTTYNDGLNIRQQSTVSYPIYGSKTWSGVGTSTTSVNNGYVVDGQGGAHAGPTTGSGDSTTVGVGVRKTFP
jgi:hypothetical protein